MVNSSQRRQTGRSTSHTILRCNELTVWRDDWFPLRQTWSKFFVFQQDSARRTRRLCSQLSFPVTSPDVDREWVHEQGKREEQKISGKEYDVNKQTIHTTPKSTNKGAVLPAAREEHGLVKPHRSVHGRGRGVRTPGPTSSYTVYARVSYRIDRIVSSGFLTNFSLILYKVQTKST